MSVKPPVRLDKIAADDKIKINATSKNNENILIAYDGSYDAIEPPIKDWKNLLSKNKVTGVLGATQVESRMRNNGTALQPLGHNPHTMTHSGYLSMTNSSQNFYSPTTTTALSIGSPSNAQRASPPSYTSMKVLHNRERLKRLKKLATVLTDSVPNQILRSANVLTP